MTFNPDGSFNTSIEKEPLTEEQTAEVERFLRFLAKNRATLVDYLVCASNHRDCTQLPEKLKETVFNTDNLIIAGTTVGVQMHVIVDKFTSAFISACGTFRDRLLKREGAKSGTDHPLTLTTNMIYDNSFEYRLFYNLRNVGLHQEAIFHNLPVSGDWLNNDKFSVDLGMKPQALAEALGKGQGQKRVREELKKMDEDVDFLEAAQKYLFHMKNLFFVHLLNQRDEIQNFLHFFAALKSGVRGAPTDATLLIFNDYEPPKNRDQDGCFSQDVNITHLSLDEAEWYLKLFPELQQALDEILQAGSVG